jgi:hypothetical protein
MPDLGQGRKVTEVLVAWVMMIPPRRDRAKRPRRAGRRIRLSPQGGTRSPTRPCGTPCCRAGCHARATLPVWSRRCGRCSLRTSITDAVQTMPGTNPDRTNYQIAVETAQDLATGAHNITGPDGDLARHWV